MNVKSNQAKDIFVDLIGNVPPAEWERRLAEATGRDEELHRRVQALLRAHAEPGSFMEQPAVTIDVNKAGNQVPLEEPGTQIGPYKLLRQIGEGGMGVVYMAEQKEPVKRPVALKIIKPGMDTRQVIARFEAERQALAMMDHPKIAKVLDAGTTESARPYFVMELVNGIPITEFCDEKELSTRERLELFVQVCLAVQHAHTKGVIHRDIKPSNVMVTLSDGRPVPKVIDFGVAKALSQQLTDKTVYTADGQLVGTPLYMSPEQAQLSAHDVDTRSDIYSLGVLLYELLTGRTPFDRETLQKSGLDEMRRIIREVDPPRPSARISTLQASDRSTVSDRRRIGMKELSHSLRGELDWIVMKALEKDRTRRYETANAFAADVQRYLRDEPIHARPPSTAYRLRKFARRNSAALVSMVLVVISLLAGTGVSIWLAVRATDAERLSELRLEDVGKQRQRAESNLQLALETLEQIYLPLAKDEFSEQTELTDRDRQFLQKVLPFYEQLAAQKADDPQMLYVKAHAYLRVGNIYRDLRTHPDEKNEPAEAGLRQAIALFKQLTGEFPGDLNYQQKLAQSYRSLGTLLHPRRRREAEEAFHAAIALYESVVTQSDDAWVYASRATCYREIRRYDMAVADYGKAVELEPDNAQFHHNLCLLYTSVRVRDLGLAVKHARLAVELEPDNTNYNATLAYASLRNGNLVAARQACAKALALDANLPEANLQMSEILRREGDFQQALVFAEKAFQDGEPRHPHTAYASRGKAYASLGQYQQALADYDKAVSLAPRDLYLRRGRGKIYAKLGRFADALADYTKAIEQDPENTRLLNNTSWEMVRDPGWEPKMAEQAVTWVQQVFELKAEGTAKWNTLGVAHYRAGNWQEAIAPLEKSVAVNPEFVLGYSGMFLAMAHWQLGHKDEARQWYDRSVEWIKKKRPDDEYLLAFQAEAEELMGIANKKESPLPISRQSSDALDSAATSKPTTPPTPRSELPTNGIKNSGQ